MGNPTRLKIEINKEQLDLIVAAIRKERDKQDQLKEIGKRMFRKYSKILFALTGKNY